MLINQKKNFGKTTEYGKNVVISIYFKEVYENLNDYE